MNQASELLTSGAFIRAKAALHPDRILIKRDPGALTYAEADLRSRRLARGLLATGVGKGTRVGILLPNSPDWVLAWLATTRIGAQAVLLNTFSAPRELGWLLRHADVSTLLTAGRFLNADYPERLETYAPALSEAVAGNIHIPALPYLREVRCWHDESPRRAWTSGGALELEALAEASPEIDDAFLAEIEREVRPADPMVVVYSSGSTAEPKGAIHTHGTVLRHAHNLNQQRDLLETDRVYSPMPFFWVGGLVFTLVAAMDVGCTLHVEDVFEPGRILDLIERERITLVAGWPHYGKAMAEHPSFGERDISSVRAGNLYDLLPAEARPADPELRHGSLGMTETCGPHTFGAMDVDLPEKLRGSFGQAVSGIEHQIVDPLTGEALEAGAFGEIAVRGYSIAQGLYKLEREQVFTPDGYYRTGDGGYFDSEGHLFFRGRLGEGIKTAGANVTPREVELVLEAWPEVMSAHVVGVPHADRGENVAAAVLLREGAAVTREELRARLREDLSAYKMPRHVYFLSPQELPMTDTGKLDRRRLKALLVARIAAGDEG